MRHGTPPREMSGLLTGALLLARAHRGACLPKFLSTFAAPAPSFPSSLSPSPPMKSLLLRFSLPAARESRQRHRRRLEARHRHAAQGQGQRLTSSSCKSGADRAAKELGRRNSSLTAQTDSNAREAKTKSSKNWITPRRRRDYGRRGKNKEGHLPPRSAKRRRRASRVVTYDADSMPDARLVSFVNQATPQGIGFRAHGRGRRA